MSITKSNNNSNNNSNKCLWCKKTLRKFSKKGFKPRKTHLKCYKIWKINEDLKSYKK